MKIKLIRPCIDYKDSFLEALKESQKEDEFLYWNYDAINNDFQTFINGLLEKEILCPYSKVPETILWAMHDETYVGRIAIRHQLTKKLEERNGNIGYDVRPTYRKKGLGTEILRLGLKEALKIGLREVLLTTDDSNVGSNKIIENNGGVLKERKMLQDNSALFRYYWIQLKS